uniref:Putative extracellular protein TR9_081 n=1 Tax=Trebouxia lynnae TaxID=1825957 RepID=A0A7L9QEL3_9CHLO|nr:putative extracellular protein TR9_081 [Trebouxia lynnae]
MQLYAHVCGVAVFWGFVALLTALPADGLSDTICDNIEAEWQSDEPRLEGAFPFYTLLVSCTGNLTLEGYSVDSCVNNGRDCGAPAADAFCNYLGLDGSAYDNQFTVMLPASAPTHAMTGEWCTQNGSYSLLNDTSLQAISSYKGPFCNKLDSVLCYRSRNSSLAIFTAEQDKADDLLAPGPAPSIASVVVGNIDNSVPSHNVTNSPQVVALAQNTSANASTAQAG